MDYRWIISHVGSDYGWALLDPTGERVSSGTAPSRAAAVVAAEQARWRIRQAEGDRSEGDQNSS
jgi:hypothetical protein